MPAVTAPIRRHDPRRRDRIIEACLQVIAEVGVAGVSHRRIASVADVPLGSMTYHFTGMDSLLHEAFSRFADRAADQFDRAMITARDADSARQAVVEAILSHPTRSTQTLVLTQELYTLAARDPRYRDITDGWMRRSRAALAAHFDPVTARLIDALIEGLTLHRALDLESDPDPYGTAMTTAAIDRITRTGGQP
jgi:DNA-binding transcriptional regulator YbjK